MKNAFQGGVLESLTEIQSQITTEDMDDLSMVTFRLSQAATNVYAFKRWIACKPSSFPHNEVDPVTPFLPNNHGVDNGVNEVQAEEDFSKLPKVWPPKLLGRDKQNLSLSKVDP